MYCIGGNGDPVSSGSDMTYEIIDGSSSGTTCSDPAALNEGGQAACEYFADLTDDEKKAKLVELDKPGKQADSAYGNKVTDPTGWATARSEARVAAKEARRAQIKEGITAANWKDMIIEDTDFEGYTDKVLAKRGTRAINYRFVPVGDHAVTITPEGALNVASTDPLESFDLDVNACLTITVTDLGDIKVCKDTVGLTVACDTGAPVDKSAGDAVQCLGYEWDVGSLTYDGGCVQNASLQDHDSDPSTPDQCTCKPGYEVNDAGDACVADLCATDNAADYINAQCCQC